MTDTVTSSRKVDRIMYVCTDCHDAGKEICCYADRRDLGVMPDGRWLCENCLSELPEKATKGMECPPAYASAEQGTHDDGIDLALTQLCKFLGVEQKSVTWDAATETVEGDVSAVIGNILSAKFGEDWRPDDTDHIDWDILAEERLGQRPPSSQVTRSELVGDKRRSGSEDSAPLAQSIEPPATYSVASDNGLRKLAASLRESADGDKPEDKRRVMHSVACFLEERASPPLSSKESQ